MSEFEIIMFLIGLVHANAGSIYNKYRIKNILNYIFYFRGALLDERQFSDLLNKYTSFLAPAQLFPDRKLYSSLYSDQEFAEFCSKSKLIIFYIYFIIISCSFVAIF